MIQYQNVRSPGCGWITWDNSRKSYQISKKDRNLLEDRAPTNAILLAFAVILRQLLWDVRS